ncbi:hypothetical protein [Bartonella taylorii]|uniref:hypothetical protein n=1 Tax=Bartonella taylorii TaxID=33046 RepID=UPI001ABB2F84|nr:hypothetical protein [Bartonella taylorii]
MLSFIGYWSLFGLIIIAILFFMVIVGLHYFFIKRVRLYFSMLKELKKRAIPPLCSHEGEIKGKDLVFERGAPSFSFTKFMAFEPKEYKILFFISVIIAVLLAVGNMVFTLDEKGDASVLVLLLSNMAACAFFFIPIIGLLCIKMTSKLKKAIQLLEEAIQQRDKAVHMQSVIGEGNDE